MRECLADGPLRQGERIAVPDVVTELDTLASVRSHQRFLVIDWEGDAGSGRCHYLTGNPPFDARQYRRWLEQTYGDFWADA